MKSFAKADGKNNVNLKEQVKTRRKSVGLEVKLPANVILDGDLKQREKHIAAIVEILNKKEYIRSVGTHLILYLMVKIGMLKTCWSIEK
jgi:hypothetical protein